VDAKKHVNKCVFLCSALSQLTANYTLNNKVTVTAEAAFAAAAAATEKLVSAMHTLTVRTVVHS
jgi:hypothetical protein